MNIWLTGAHDDFGGTMKELREGWKRQWRFVALGLIIILLIATLGYMSGIVKSKLDKLEREPHDNLQWTLSQLDVEHTRFAMTARNALRNPYDSLTPLRHRFDLYYSRVDTVAAMRGSEHLPQSDVIDHHMGELQALRTQLANIIDQPESELRDELPQLMKLIEQQRDLVRDLTADAVEWFASASDQRQADFARLLSQVALVAILLGFALLLVVYSLYRLKAETEKSQARLAQVTARLKSTVGASLDAVMVMDENGILLDYDGAAEDIFGYTRDEVLGKNILNYFVPDGDHIPADGNFRAFLEAQIEPVVGQGLVKSIARKQGGDTIPIEISIATVKDHGATMYIAFVRDISDRIAANRKLKRSRDQALAAAEAKSDFIAVMSHEMRTPLNGVVAAHDILAATDLSPHQDQFLKIAQSSATHLLQHVNDVLEISSIDAQFITPQISVTNPYAVISNIIDNAQSLAMENGNTLECDFTGADGRYYCCDERRLRRILLNLLGNALKFTKNGRVQVDFTITPRDETASCLEIHVTDNGRGIPQDKLDEIFEDFVRLDAGYDRDTDGTGLGLSITRRMVGALGGRIGVESEEGVGSTFWVRLPLSNCPQPNESTKVAPSAAPSACAIAKRRALIVEDNEINRTVMQQFLEELGFDVDTASNGQAGIEMAMASAFDYVFMDVSMPVLDGISATRTLRETTKNASQRAKIVGFTAHSSAESRQECKSAGMDDILIKPVTRASLAEVLAPKHQTLSPANNARQYIIDQQQIDELRSVLGEEQFAANWGRFEAEVRDGIDEILSSTPKASANENIAQVHNLAGLSASMGATRLYKRLQTAQFMAETNNPSALVIALNEAIKDLDRTLASLTE
ncbi:ATP-binding protein [Falsihalocynthiibacter sp. SS001]|uniref:PAS domain-containing hybrid sensor histidine kinase/response regulator n=1 Tax=Falsihalocynthiibacter sp. SS001 TaxID=3349698 RepID=UPI0036D31CC1